MFKIFNRKKISETPCEVRVIETDAVQVVSQDTKTQKFNTVEEFFMYQEQREADIYRNQMNTSVPVDAEVHKQKMLTISKVNMKQ